MRRIFLFLFFVFPVLAQTDYTPLRNQINELLNDDFFQSSAVSLSIYDLTEKREVIDIDSKKLLRPGSNMKILTSAAGLLFLGPDYSFTTGLYYTGEILNNILYGDIYVRGGCDPDFNFKDLNTLLSLIKEKNIYEVSGRIILDLSMKDSLFWGHGWMWDDDPSTDAPYLSALNINDNAIKIFVKPGDLLGKAIVRTEPVTNFINILNTTLTTTELKEPLVVDRQWLYRSNDITVTGTISPADSEVAVILNLYSPDNYFSTLCLEELRKNDIKISGDIGYGILPDNAIQLGEINRRYDTVLVNLNKVSDNLSAEMVVYALAEKYYGRPASAVNGLKLIDSLIILSGLNPDDYNYVDGSGVSHYNLISPDLINSILRYLYYSRNDLFQKLHNSFPIAGKDGTLKTRMKGTLSEGNVHAKTGTLSGVSSLSGYVNSSQGNFLSFSIMVQNFTGSSVKAKSFQDKICNLLSTFHTETSGLETPAGK